MLVFPAGERRTEEVDVRIHTLLAPILAFSLAGCSLYDPLHGQKKAAPDDPIPDPPVVDTYDIPLSTELRGTGLDLDTGMTESWYYGPGECHNHMALVGWDLAAFEQHDLAINDNLGSYGTDLEGRPVESRELMMVECRERGVLVTTDQGAVFLLTDALVYGPYDQQRFSVTAELVEPGICDPACGAGRLALVRLGRVQVELDQGLLVETSGAACGVPSEAYQQPFDLLFEPSAITASQARLAFVPGRTFADLHTRPAPEDYGLETVAVPAGRQGVIVIETDEGRVFKLDPLLNDEGRLTGVDFERL